MRHLSLTRLRARATRTAARPFRIDRAKTGAGAAALQHKLLVLRHGTGYHVFEPIAGPTPPDDHAERAIPIMTALSTGFRPIRLDRI